MTKHIPFVHLHLHTSYSLLDGACRIPQLMEAAQQNNMPAIAVTDHGVMYGIIDFYQAARAKGIKPILGCEVYEAPGSRFDRKTDHKTTANHLVLLATDQTGYSNLVRLVTSAHLEGFYYKPRVDRDILSQYHKGLICLSGCLKGRVAECLLSGNEKTAIRTAGEYADIFGKDNFFLEIQDHDLPDQKKVNPGLVKISRQTGLPLAATNDVHYLGKEDAAAHEVLLCMQTGTVLSDPNHMRYGSSEFYLKNGEEMNVLFGDIPEALENTLEIAHRCNVELEFNRLHFPVFQVPEGYSQKSYLTKLCMEGVKQRYGIENPEQPHNDRQRTIISRLNYEIDVIEKTGFIGYFLVVWDFVRFAHEHQIPVGPGRGSGAGSLVSYALGITGVDPLHYNLVFERFMNPERVDPPDFDIDFCQFRRGEVIEYVKEKYGRDNVAQIITFGSLGAKTAIRDVGRALQVPIPECNRLAKMVPDDPKITLEEAMNQNPELKKASMTEPNAKRIMEYALVLEGLLRHAGLHAAGVVFSDKPLADMLPLSLDKSGEVVTQYSKDHVDALGLLKADFLGLKTLTVIDETVKLIKQTKGVSVDIHAIPMDDPRTFHLLRLGNTVGVFQLESRGMRELVRRIGLDKIEDLIAMIALFRPGPMNMLDDYVNRKTGKVKISYDDRRLEPILSETYGVMLYQEQVQQAAHILAGYSLGQGDILRRAMGKKKPEEMERQRKSFVEGCKKEGKMTAGKAEKIFEHIAKFAGYGFNKSHSTGYAIIAYQTAWLKANYPEEFMAALLSSEIGNTDKLPVFMTEAKEIGLEILPPDVNASGSRFMPQEKAIRFGLAGIKNVGESAAEALVRERDQNGPYCGLIDCCLRLDAKVANRKCMETLVRCGAFGSFGIHRARLFNSINLAISRAEAVQSDRKAGQTSLFSLLEDSSGDSKAEVLPDCPPWHENELLSAEKELLGIYMSGHPLSKYEPILRRYRLSTAAGLKDVAEGSMTRVGGVIAKAERKVTKSNKETMAVLQIEDVEGTLEAVVFPKTYRTYEKALNEGEVIMICGQVAGNEDAIKVIVSEVYPLDQVPGVFAERISLHLAAASMKDDLLEKIRGLLKAHPGHTPVVFCLQFPTGEEVFMDTDNSFQVTPSETLIQDLEHLFGEDSVYVAVMKRACRNINGRRKNNNASRWRR